MCKYRRMLLAVVTLFCSRYANANDELLCLPNDERANGGLYAELQKQAYVHLDQRLLAFEKLKTPDEIRTRQKQLREFFVQQLGGFPARTPLNAQTVKKVPGDGYSIECVIFESQPNHHVTANLYLPDGVSFPVPGIVISSGHSRTAKTADYNQRFGIAMAKHGMAALCFDPIGQGERSQIIQDGKNQYGSTTTEHFLIGFGSTLVGRNTATYRIWDAMRAIDYLSQRDEIDAERIGMTGCSGGGTLTSYVMALDDRVQCAAPACYLTTYRRLIETIGPQDAEQNIYGQITFGMDQPDYVFMRAPRPTIISSTTADFFDIDGSWDNLRQAKRIYGKLGAPEKVDLVEIEGKHGVQPQNLATITHWMQRWLLGIDQPVDAAVYPVLNEAELLCTESGQVLAEFDDEKSVFDFNSEVAESLQQQREQQNTAPTQLRKKLHSILGVPNLKRLPAPKFKDLGRVKRDDYHIDKLVLRREGRLPLPGLTFHPESPVDDAYLYLHDNGKLTDAPAVERIEDLVNEGFAVVTVDLSGQGETSGGKQRDKLLTDWKTYYLSYLLGRPLVGIRAEDVLASAHFVAFYQKAGDKPRKVHLVASGHTAIVALHAAALMPDRFESIVLRDLPPNWSSVAGQTNPAGQLDSAIHGALKHYDLPDLIRLAGGKAKIRLEPPASER